MNPRIKTQQGRFVADKLSSLSRRGEIKNQRATVEWPAGRLALSPLQQLARNTQ